MPIAPPAAPEPAPLPPSTPRGLRTGPVPELKMPDNPDEILELMDEEMKSFVTQGEAPTLIDGMNVEEILFPKPYEYIYAGIKFKIYPMSDEKLAALGDALEKICGVLQYGVSISGAVGADGKLDANSLMDQLPSILSLIPTAVRQSLPDVSRVISMSLDIPLEKVQKMPLYHKVGLIQGILEAENIPLLIKNVVGLAGITRPTEPPTQPKEKKPKASP